MGYKKRVLAKRIDYSFQIGGASNNGFIKEAKLSETEAKLSETEAKLSETEAKLSETEAKLSETEAKLSETEARLRETEVRLSETEIWLKKQVSPLKKALAECKNELFLRNNELARVLESTSWRITAPIRNLIVFILVLKVNLHILTVRSGFVIRQEGISTFIHKAIGVTKRYRQKKTELKNLKHFNIDQKILLSSTNVPIVSFVIPIYDRTDILRASINSVLESSLQIFEVILVTDGSPPETLAVVEEFRPDPRIKIFNYPVSSGNAVRGRNKGILEARGRYIAFLDSDDISTYNRLEVSLPMLESGEADVVYGAWKAILDGSRIVDSLYDGQVIYSPDCNLEMLKQTCVPCQSTVIVRRELLLRTGLLKPKMQYREDHELWLRLAYNGAKFKAVPHVLTNLRLHLGNNELNFKDNDAHWEALLAEEYRLPGPIPKKICFLVENLALSGGLAVVLKHASMLAESGHDVSVIVCSASDDASWFGNLTFQVYYMAQMPSYILDNIDLLFATFWTTVSWLEKIPARRKLYLVQSDERLFYNDYSIKEQVESTYRGNYEYVTIAKWLVDMLYEEFGKIAIYVPNGLDVGLFHPRDPLEKKNPKRLRVLLEGPISVPFKGVSEAYLAVKDLECEIWIVSSNGKPKKGWHYDRFFEGVNHK